jgi:hypothetical protein
VKPQGGKRGQATLIASAQLPLSKVAVLWFDKLCILDDCTVSEKHLA